MLYDFTPLHHYTFEINQSDYTQKKKGTKIVPLGALFACP